MKGTIDIYFRERGFGFISSTETGRRVTHYFHISGVIQGDPVTGAPVEFELASEAYKKGSTKPAVNVVVLDGGAK